LKNYFAQEMQIFLDNQYLTNQNLFDEHSNRLYLYFFAKSNSKVALKISICSKNYNLKHKYKIVH
jgi:hypothetical protein